MTDAAYPPEQETPRECCANLAMEMRFAADNPTPVPISSAEFIRWASRLERAVRMLDEEKASCRDCERFQVQLAGVSVAAMGGTGPDSRAVQGQYGWSVAYQDTLDLRLRYDAAVAALEGIADGEESDALRRARTALANIRETVR